MNKKVNKDNKVISIVIDMVRKELKATIQIRLEQIIINLENVIQEIIEIRKVGD